MCEYCEKVFTEDTNEELIDEDIKVNGSIIMGVSTFIDDDGDSPMLVIAINDAFGNVLMKKIRMIKYCPVCGRKLKD